MRVSGIKVGAPRASPLPQDMLYTFYGRQIFSEGEGEQLLHAWYKHRVRAGRVARLIGAAASKGSFALRGSLDRCACQSAQACTACQQHSPMCRKRAASQEGALSAAFPSGE